MLSIRVRLASVFFFFILSLSFAQEFFLSKKAPLWNKVSTGRTICTPVTVPEGFVIAHDGNSFVCFSKSGEILWQKKRDDFPKNLQIASSKYGILYFAGKNGDLNVLNSSGVSILKIKNENDVSPGNSEDLRKEDLKKIEYILPGMDGRFFIFSGKKILCYGHNGICKWQVEIEFSLQTEPELADDGSFFVFFSEQKAVKISPYGEIMEILEFPQRVVKAFCTDSSLYVLFSDKTIKKYGTDADGRFSADFNVKTFALPDEIQLDLNDAIFFGISDEIMRPSSGINQEQKQLLLCTNKEMFCFLPAMLSEKNANGELKEFKSGKSEIFRKVIFDIDNLYENSFLTDGSYLLLSKPTWETMYFKFAEPAHKNIKISKIEAVQGNLSLQSARECRKILMSGIYGSTEKELAQAVYQVMNSYFTYLNTPVNNMKVELPEFVSNREFLSEVFTLSGMFGTDSFAEITSKLITEESVDQLLISLINACGNAGFDPNYMILSAIDRKISQTAIMENAEIINSVCNSLYKLCRTMGDSYAKRAVNILAKIIVENSGQHQRAKAQETLLKIKKLKA